MFGDGMRVVRRGKRRGRGAARGIYSTSTAGPTDGRWQSRRQEGERQVQMQVQVQVQVRVRVAGAQGPRRVAAGAGGRAGKWASGREWRKERSVAGQWRRVLRKAGSKGHRQGARGRFRAHSSAAQQWTALVTNNLAGFGLIQPARGVGRRAGIWGSVQGSPAATACGSAVVELGVVGGGAD